MTDAELLLFSRGYSNLYEDSKILLQYLIENGSFYGTMTELSKRCNRPRVIKNRKVVMDLFSQFRRFGILKLKEYGVINYTKTEAGYIFTLQPDWKVKIIELGNINCSRSNKYKHKE